MNLFDQIATTAGPPTWQQHKQPPHFPLAVLALISVSVRWRLPPPPPPRHPTHLPIRRFISCRRWQSSWCLMFLHRSGSVVCASPGSWLHPGLFAQQSSPGLGGAVGERQEEAHLLLEAGGGKGSWRGFDVETHRTQVRRGFSTHSSIDLV